MTAQMPTQTASERPVSTPVDRIFSVVNQPKAKGGLPGKVISKTPKPRFDKVNISWEYFQNELEFE